MSIVKEVVKFDIHSRVNLILSSDMIRRKIAMIVPQINRPVGITTKNIYIGPYIPCTKEISHNTTANESKTVYTINRAQTNYSKFQQRAQNIFTRHSGVLGSERDAELVFRFSIGLFANFVLTQDGT